MFAVSDVDPTVGTIKARHTNNNKAGNKKHTDIELVNCKELLPGGKHAGESNSEYFDIEDQIKRNSWQELLCPISVLTLDI